MHEAATATTHRHAQEKAPETADHEPTPPERIGIYDSRVIAYAHFWTDTHQRQFNETVCAAKAAGDTNRCAELETALSSPGFSTASVEELLAEMPDQIAAVQKEAGITRLISKWDEDSLKEYSRAEYVDVTNLLLRDFNLTEKQRRAIADIRRKEPLPIHKATRLLEEGKL